MEKCEKFLRNFSTWFQVHRTFFKGFNQDFPKKKTFSKIDFWGGLQSVGQKANFFDHFFKKFEVSICWCKNDFHQKYHFTEVIDHFNIKYFVIFQCSITLVKQHNVLPL